MNSRTRHHRPIIRRRKSESSEQRIRESAWKASTSTRRKRSDHTGKSSESKERGKDEEGETEKLYVVCSEWKDEEKGGKGEVKCGINEAIRRKNPFRKRREESDIPAKRRRELPKIHLPGDEKFNSYKNSFQCYHQKVISYTTLPVYKAETVGSGWVGSITFSSTTVRSKEVSGSVKEAEARAAFEALVHVGYLQGVEFDGSSYQENAQTDENSVAAVPASAGQGPQYSKHVLYDLAIKKKLPHPVYTCELVPGTMSFKATVVFDGNEFKSSRAFKKKKDAEQNAAQVAVEALAVTPLPSAGGVEAVTPVPAVTPKPSLPSKNILQEYCQKRGIQLPVYVTTTAGVNGKAFKSVVTVKETEYHGVVTSGKKSAEASAAEVAMKELSK